MAALPIPILAAVNHVLGQADWARERLTGFAGRSARVTMPPFDAFIVVLLSMRFHDASADVSVPSLKHSPPFQYHIGRAVSHPSPPTRL